MTSTAEIAKDLFCGCMSGWGQVVSMLPFENIKIKVISKPEQYNNGYVDAFKKTIKEEGAMSLYKGMLFPLIGVGAQVAVQFGFVQSIKKVVKQSFSEPDGSLHWKFSFLAGALTGIPSGLVLTPLDHARFRVTLNKQKGLGSVGMAAKIYKQYGLKKLYLGFNASCLREIIGLAFYFGTYDLLCRNFQKDGRVSVIGSLLCGGIAGMACWTAMYPVDYVKTLIQTGSLETPAFKSATQCAISESKKGFTIFYRAYTIMMARAFVCNAFGFMCYQFGKRLVY